MDFTLALRLLLTLLMLAGCATPQFQGTYWKLTSIDGAAIPAMDTRNEAHLQFTEANAVNGSTGCNRFMGNYVRQGNNLHFGKIAATRRFCAETAELETAFLAMLEQVTAFEIKDDSLVFQAGGKIVAEWQARTDRPQTRP